MDEEARQRYLDGIREIIDEYGWAVQAVGGPGWMYTIGLSLREPPLPELLTVGLGQDVAHAGLNELARRQVEHSMPLPVGLDLYDVIGGGFPVQVRRVEEEVLRAGEWVQVLLAIRDDDMPEVLQVVYPDYEGRYPWDDGYDLAEPEQPLL